MPKMSHPCNHHGQVVFAAIFNAVLVADGATRLDKGRDSCFVAEDNAIIEWEESITCHYCTVQIKIELPGFFNCMPKGVNPAGLSAAFAYQLLVFHKGNGI